MTSIKKYECPHCEQTSSRKWNLKVHIDRAHGTGKSYSSSGFHQANANSGSSIRGPRDTNSPSPTFAATNKISEARWIWQGSAVIDQIYRLALEVDGNRIKFNKAREVFGGVPYPIIQQINAEPLNFFSEITSAPPISPPGRPFQKSDNISPSVGSDMVKDSNVRGITESNKTTHEKPKKPTFDEYRKIKPEVTFDEYRGLCRDPVTDWEPVLSGSMLVKRNAFGEVVDFLILRKCGIYM
jgi:hypothetical protein